MAWHLVEGFRIPDAVGGHPALDFCNTRTGWGLQHPKEYLVASAVLPVWCADVGLLDADTAAALRRTVDERPAQATAALERAMVLREALYGVVLGQRAGPAWSVVAEEAARARAAMRLVPRPSAPAAWEFVTRPAPPDDLAVLAVAAAAADLLTSPAASCVAACPGEGCGWVFTDPRRRRRWCSMAWCGNRAKARRHAERTKSVRLPS